MGDLFVIQSVSRFGKSVTMSVIGVFLASTYGISSWELFTVADGDTDYEL